MLLLKLALRPWRLAPLSQVFSALAVGFLLLLSGFLFWLQDGLKPVVSRLQREQVITAYLDPSLELKDETVIVDSVRLALGAHSEKVDIQLVQATEFLGNLKKQYPDLAREVEDLGQDMPSIVPRYVSASGLFADTAVEKVRAVAGIESAESSKDRYHHIVGAFSALRWVARLLVGGLCLALVTGLIHLARMNAYMHRDSLALIRLWGASNGAIQVPGLVSGLLVGGTGGVLALSGWLLSATWLSSQVRTLSPMLRDLPTSSPQFGAALLGAGVLMGLVAGIVGNLSVRQASASRGGGRG